MGFETVFIILGCSCGAFLNIWNLLKQKKFKFIYGLSLLGFLLLIIYSIIAPLNKESIVLFIVCIISCILAFIGVLLSVINTILNVCIKFKNTKK